MSINDVKPLISIIVPVYNVEKYLNKCIESISNQTYNFLEIILVDDGSDDASSIICDEWSKKDSRIKVVHKDNEGLSCARNTGLKIANGELIGFVDSDDYIDLNMYELLYNNMIKYNSDISICNFNIINKKTKCIHFNNKEFFVSNKEKFNNLKNELQMVTVVAWNKLYKRSVFDNFSYPQGKIYEDEFVICILLERAKIVSYILIPLYNYVLRPDSISNTISINRLDCIDAINVKISFYQNKHYDDLLLYEMNRKCKLLIYYISKLKSENLYYKNYLYCNNYYNDLKKTSKSINYNEAHIYTLLYKILGPTYLLIKETEIRIWNNIKKIKIFNNFIK